MTADVMLVVDMQEGLRLGEPKHDLAGVVSRINTLSERVRQRGGRVLFVRHEGEPGDPFAPGAPGWEFLRELSVGEDDRVVAKLTNDPFHDTDLASHLGALEVDRLLIGGWATDLCVDATVRSAVARGLPVTVVSDCHTVSDRPHMPAEKVIEHHHWVWSNLIARPPVSVVPESEV